MTATITDTDKVQSIRELVEDWQDGKLSDVAALYAVCIIVRAARLPSQADIEWAEKIYPRLLEMVDIDLVKLADKHKEQL